MIKIRNLYKKYKEIINYIVFGVMTTVVNFAVYFLCVNVIGVYYIESNIIAWFLAVLFAYVTNRIYVFERVNFSTSGIIKEAILFFLSRFLSGAIETASLYIMVDIIGINNGTAKIEVAVAVVILNYIFSKLVVFRKHGKNRNKK